MSRFALRSHSENSKFAEKDMDITKSPNVRLKKGQQKGAHVTTNFDKHIQDTTKRPYENCSIRNPNISTISIICRLPLYKLPGIIDKIRSPFLNQIQCNKVYPLNENSDKRNQTLLYTKTMCLYCDKNFSSQNMQKKHVEKFHIVSKERRFSSRNSNAQSPESKVQVTTQQSPVNAPIFSGCTYCKNTKGHISAPINGLIALFFHLIETHKDRYFGCKLCIIRFQNNNKLTEHMQSMHNNVSFSSEDTLKSIDECLSSQHNERLPQLQTHFNKTITSHRSTSSLSQETEICSINVMKSTMFSGDEPILSRLGVAQNRLPSNRKGLRLRRDTAINDILLKSDQSCSKIRNKNVKTDYTDVVFRVPTRTDTVSCIFDDNFYDNVISNVRNNILYHLDGKIIKNLSCDQLSIIKQSSPEICNSEIHVSTNIASTTFPTLLTAEQYGADATTTKMKRSITKHSWKWKWDSFKKFKLVSEGGKIIKKIKQPIVSMRDLSKLDMWTQLTMRQKNEFRIKSFETSLCKTISSLYIEEKQRLNNELNNILDTRLLPHIIQEQSEQSIIKFEYNEIDVLLDGDCTNKYSEVSHIDVQFFEFLNLLPSNANRNIKHKIVLSGEWARPRCYLCIGCGSNFEKLKSLEEHRMFRHSHVYSTHYEIVGRQLMANNLLRNFFIPKKALIRYERNKFILQKEISNTNKRHNTRHLHEEESSDSTQSITHSCSKNSMDDGDIDTKIIINVNVSPTHSNLSCTSVSTHVSKFNRETSISCTKCNRKCSGVLDLYRHMLDCSGDYVWNMVKKRKYRYYCGSKKRRHFNKFSNANELKKRKQKTVKENTTFSDNLNDVKTLKTKTPPRQRPSDEKDMDITKSPNVRLKKGQQKGAHVTTNFDKHIQDTTKRPYENCSIRNPNISTISIICRLPLYKLPGIIDKIRSPFLNQIQCNKVYPLNENSDKRNQTLLYTKTMCLYCDKNFSSQNMQKKHVEKFHIVSKERRFSSRNSNAQSPESKVQVTTQQSPVNAPIFSGCTYCKNTKGHISAPINGLIALFFHLIETHKDRYFGCKLCIIRFQNNNKLTEHMQSMHNNVSFSSEDTLKSIDECLSSQHNERLPQLQTHFNKTITSHRSTSSLSQETEICSINVMKSTMFSGDEPILSRLGVAQNRLPSNRKGLRLRRDTAINDILLKSDQSCSKIRNKNVKTDYTDVVFRVPTRTDTVSCIFDDNFYDNVISNVRNNILYHLDGKIIKNLSCDQLSIIKQSSPEICNSEIHVSTNIASTTFPTLLTAEQYGADATTTKMKRSITKHSWKWKWDSFKKFKLVSEGGKIIKKIKQPIVSMRDLSKLDMWTQLTMRQKNEFRIKSFETSLCKTISSLYIEEKQRLNNELNNILDTRLLPHIIQEQSEQSIIKFEYNEIDVLLDGDCTNKYSEVSHIDVQFFEFLNLLPSNANRNIKHKIVLSGEWARPRCYLCIGCGSNFEKLKSLEEHRMFRHSHVYSTHYEIVGRQLMANNLLRNFFIPKKALIRYERNKFILQKEISNTNKRHNTRHLHEEESSDSTQSITHSCSKNSMDDGDIDTKIIINVNVSPTHSNLSCTSVSTHVSKFNRETSISCTKCNRKCSGVLDLYRHMLDCSGDYVWNMVKKRKYRYYCGSKKRRHFNKFSNANELKKRKQKTVKENTTFSDNLNDVKTLKTKTPPRQRPSDAESIKKMLENLPPKRICKKILPTINKTRKSRLMAKRNMYNTQRKKQKISKRIRQTNTKCNILQSNILNKKCIYVDQKVNLANFNKKADTRVTNETKYSLMLAEKKSINTAENKKLINSTTHYVESNEKSKDNNLYVKLVETPDVSVLLSNQVNSSKQNQIVDNNNIDASSCNSDTHLTSLNKCKSSKDFSTTSNNSPKEKTILGNNCKGRRSKKINDCIAMLTGKLEEKLKTEQIVELKEKRSSKELDYFVNTMNKSKKRKTFSRKIVKTESNINKNNEINILEDSSQRLANVSLYIQTINNVQLPSNELTSSLSKCTEVLPNNTSNGQLENKCSSTNEHTTLWIPSTVFMEAQSKPLSRNSCYDLAPDSTNIINHSTSILPPSTRHNIPTRRKTICAIEGNNQICTYNDLEPLDLSNKPKDISAKRISDVYSLPEIVVGSTNESSALAVISPSILQSTHFYSNLDLLKIPQVRGVACLHLNNEKLICKKSIPNTKYNNNKSNLPFSPEISNKYPMTTSSSRRISANSKDGNKTDNTLKIKYIPKMDEAVINHIDDAINSVINAECELETLEKKKIRKETATGNEISLIKEKSANIEINDFKLLKLTDVQKVITQVPSKNTYTEIRNVTTESKDKVAKKNKRAKTEDSVSTMRIVNLPNVPQNNGLQMPNTSDVHLDTTVYKKKDNIAVLELNKFQQAVTKVGEELLPVNTSCNEKEDNSILTKNIEDKLGSYDNNKIEVKNIKKQRRRRKNELAAIVADQLLESFKLDKTRRDNLKKLENLAYEKSDDLLITGMLLMTNTKRNTSVATNQFQEVFEKSNDFEHFKRHNQEQSNNISKTKRRASEVLTVETIKTKKSSIKVDQGFDLENEIDLKMSKKKQVRKHEKSVDTEHINILKSSFESFTFGSTDFPKNNSELSTKSKTALFATADTNKKQCSVVPKNTAVLRPSILSISLELPGVANDPITSENKSAIFSRDPRLNKNIHKEENVMLNVRCSIPRHRLRSATITEQCSKKQDICDIEEDNYLTEIAKNVNEKILAAENEEFIFARDEFEVGSVMQEDSACKFYRPSTSMSVRSAPNLNDDHSTDENTNTDIIDMDIDDNLSIYTSYSQDVSRVRGRRKRRRRSILFSRKPKKKFSRDLDEDKFECHLCKKTFYAASSLKTHQTTLAHVSKVSEQEYLLSKLKTKDTPCPIVESFACPENSTEIVKNLCSINKNNSSELNAFKDKHITYEVNKDMRTFSRLTLNPDERLFFECCNILKGSHASRVNDLETSNEYAFQEKNESQTFNSKKGQQEFNLNNCFSYEKNPLCQKSPKNIVTNVYRDHETFGPCCNNAVLDDICTAIEINNSAASHISAVTNTTSRFKTKAAMKGYENISTYLNKQEVKSKSVCKLTALADIALGNENSPELIVCRANSSSVELHSSKYRNDSDQIRKELKSNAANHTTSKTIMHLSILKPTALASVDVLETKTHTTNKIIIPERPFKNIGLEEKESIKFQKPKSIVNLLNTDDNSMSTVSYSDRDDFDFGSLSCDDDNNSFKNSNCQPDKNHCSNSSSSRITTKTFENKSLIMGRIFKNATGTKNKSCVKVKNSVTHTDHLPKTDLNQLFDELRGDSGKVKNDTVDNITFETLSTKLIKDAEKQLTNTSTRKIKDTKTTLNRKRNSRKNNLKLESELVRMNPEEITKLINDGQRKSKRRCASNKPKKIIEMWSSDEYEEFLSTKDIFALIEEKEKEEKKKKCNLYDVKEYSAINRAKNGNSKKKCKSKRDVSNKKNITRNILNQEKVELNNVLTKNKSKDIILTSKKSKIEDSNFLFAEEIKKPSQMSTQSEKINIFNSADDNSVKYISKKKNDLSIKRKSKKNTCTKKKSQTEEPRGKRLSSEKLYYWSSSSDEDFGRINNSNIQDYESGEQYQKHGWIVGDSHKKLVTLLAIAKGNKKIDTCCVKKETSKKRS